MSHLTIEQRYEIATLRSQGFSMSKIGEFVGRDKSVISRELSRNSDQRNNVYKADLAQSKFHFRQRKKAKKIHFTEEIKTLVISLLKEDFSPEQIVGHCKIKNLKCVSAERIYQFIWDDKKKGGQHYKHLRSKGKRYAKRGALKGSRGIIKDREGIENRPLVVEEKQRIGDLEIDLVIGGNHKGALLTINDRATGVLKMAKIYSKEAREVQEKLIELLMDWKPVLHTITSDNGKEFANHKKVSEILEIKYFFANPYCSWERGANENLNGLVRQYFPKKYNFDLITEEEVLRVTNKLNNRPRKRFGFKSPNEIFEQKLKQCA
jgi:IS30 family transposase